MSKLSQLARVIGFTIMIVTPAAIAIFAGRMIWQNIEWSKGAMATLVVEICLVFIYWLGQTIITKEGTTK